jgi:twitching motility protein PilT
MNIDEILKIGIEKKASDVHFSSNQPPWFRVDGELQTINHSPIDHNELLSALLGCIPEKIREKFEQQNEIDLVYKLSNKSRFRVNIFRQDNGIAAAFRIIPITIPSLKSLNMPPVLKELAMLPRGLVLVTGPTGAGKSTTLASIIDHINETQHKHIVTIEDPIEFAHESKKCLINQREVYRHTNSFNIALRSVLREDPNIILIGEMRDLETIRLALTAAETGHLVFATLHTLSAVKSIARIIDVFPGEERILVRTMLSGTLQAVLSQILVPKVDGGRVAATEIMICNTAIRNLIREDKLAQAYSVIQTGSINSMHTLDQHLQYLVSQNTITTLAAKLVAQDKDYFK